MKPEMITPSTIAEPSTTRPGLNITLTAKVPVCVSQVWGCGDWQVQFVRLGALESVPLDQSAGEVYVKVVSGGLASPALSAYAADREIRSTRVKNNQVRAGDSGAVITVFTATPALANNIRSMDEVQMTGPLKEHLQWQSFHERFESVTDAFKGVNAFMAPGFHLLDDDGSEIAYLHFWTAGKGVDLTTHNHGHDPSPVAPAFAELHWVLNNGTGKGGMYTTAEPGHAERTRYLIQRGEEHGPFFYHDQGVPRLRSNGAVDYPWHGWEAGSDGESGDAYDVVAAFEISPEYAQV